MLRLAELGLCEEDVLPSDRASRTEFVSVAYE